MKRGVTIEKTPGIRKYSEAAKDFQRNILRWAEPLYIAAIVCLRREKHICRSPFAEQLGCEFSKKVPLVFVIKTDRF